MNQLFERTLAEPIESPKLGQILRGAKSAAIVIDDDTRPTPVAQILPLITGYLVACGIRESAIKVVVATGTHHAMPEESLRRRVGDDVFNAFEVVNHDSLADDLVEVGELSSGRSLKINRLAAGADVRVGVGSVIPHPANGFGGGPKLIFPGICNYDAIHRHHISNFIKPHAYVGNLEQNEFYEGICEAVSKVKFDYLFNCVLNYREEVVDLVSGGPIPAFERGVELTKDNCGFAISEKADVTILSCFPYTVIPQIFKPLRAASLTTKRGGRIILVAKNVGPLPEGLVSMLQFAAKQDGDKLVAAMLEGHLTSYGAPLNLNFYVPILRALQTFQCSVVTSEIPPDVIEEMGLTHFSDFGEAIDYHRKSLPVASAHVFCAGGMTLPMFDKDFNPNTLFETFPGIATAGDTESRGA